jgi:hypothetical protein
MLTKDFREFVELLKEHKVEYLLVGGYAVGMHGFPRYTGDFDVWVNPTLQNAKKVVSTLNDFGFSSFNLSVEDFRKRDNIIQLGFPPVRIDILTGLDGVLFEECHKNAEVFVVDDIELSVIGYDDLIKNKKASGRHRDLDDLENLTKNKD